MTKPEPPCSKHTKNQPEGYPQWHAWAEKMGKTHEQIRCPDCGLWKIWIPKAPAPTPEQRCPSNCGAWRDKERILSGRGGFKPCGDPWHNGETPSALTAEQWAALLLVERNETQTLRSKLSTAERELANLDAGRGNFDFVERTNYRINKLTKRAHAAEAELARVREIEDDYRMLLATAHCGGTHAMTLYLDDGEIQCNKAGCMIDFKRDPLPQIKERIYMANKARAEAALRTGGEPK